MKHRAAAVLGALAIAAAILAVAHAVVSPSVTSTTPVSGATGVAQSAVVTATFSGAMDPTTITSSSFTLAAKGTGAAVAASVAYDAGTNTATLTPNAALGAGMTYTASIDTTVKGSRFVTTPVLLNHATPSSTMSHEMT